MVAFDGDSPDLSCPGRALRPLGAGPARALALPRDPVVVADDVLGTPGTFFSAIDRVDFFTGETTQLSAANALPDANALAFTGPTRWSRSGARRWRGSASPAAGPSTFRPQRPVT
jgi:hypothetical protein